MLALPLAVGHSVDYFTGLVVGYFNAADLRFGHVPFGQAIPAEASEVHDIDVLGVGAFLQVLDQAAKRGSFQFDPGLIANVGHYCLLMFDVSLFQSDMGAAVRNG